jgi:hypothetical protein
MKSTTLQFQHFLTKLGIDTTYNIRRHTHLYAEQQTVKMADTMTFTVRKNEQRSHTKK